MNVDEVVGIVFDRLIRGDEESIAGLEPSVDAGIDGSTHTCFIKGANVDLVATRGLGFLVKVRFSI